MPYTVHDKSNDFQVRKIYDKLQRNERNRVGTAASAPADAPCSPVAIPGKIYGPSLVDGSPSSSERRPPPSFVPAGTSTGAEATWAASGVHTVGGSSVVVPDECLVREDFDVVAVESGEGLPARPPTPQGETAGDNDTGAVRIRSDSSGCGKGEVAGRVRNAGGLVEVRTTFQVGERLQEAVRLCSVGVGCGDEGTAPGALTLSEGELSRPKQLLKALELISARGSSKFVAGGGGEGSSADESCAERRNDSGCWVQALSAGAARRAAEQPLSDPLMEMGWLVAKYPKITLVDLLVNRLHVSLWASYWRSGRGMSTGTARCVTCCHTALISSSDWRIWPIFTFAYGHLCKDPGKCSCFE